jgi:hypothetical protein
MCLSSGEQVFYKTLPEIVRHEATVVSAAGEMIVLGIQAGKGVAAGQHLMISSGDRQYFAEVVGLDGGKATLRQIWSNSREYFRVDDVVPFVARKLDGSDTLRVSRSFPFHDNAVVDSDEPDADVNPRMWRMLVNINAMLGMILERLDLRTEGFLGAERKHVNMSATGMRFRTNDRYAVGDELEIRILLPSRPPVGLLVYGSVVRADDAGNGETEIALQFTDISEDLREEIIQYALTRQREIIRKSRE